MIQVLRHDDLVRVHDFPVRVELGAVVRLVVPGRLQVRHGRAMLLDLEDAVHVLAAAFAAALFVDEREREAVVLQVLERAALGQLVGVAVCETGFSGIEDCVEEGVCVRGGKDAKIEFRCGSHVGLQVKRRSK